MVTTSSPDAVEEIGSDSTTRPGRDLWDRAWQSAVRLLPEQGHGRLLWLVLVTGLITRAVWLARPDGALIFDEKYYVNAARVILGIALPTDTYGDRPAGLDPNSEHPPLAKVLVAGSMTLLGDNPYGWRLPSVVFGMASIILVYAIGLKLAGPLVGATAAALFSLDNLVLVHSRIFTLDIFQLGFMLLGMLLYLQGRSTLAGAAFGLAALTKLGGAFGLAIVVLYEVLLLLRRELPLADAMRGAVRRLVRLVAAFTIVFLVLLTALDFRWSEYRSPVDHINRMVSYNLALRRPSGPTGIESYPWQWLWNEVQIPYLKVEAQVKVGDEVRESRPTVFFVGAMNPFVLPLLGISIAFAGWNWWRHRSEGPIGALAVAWLAATYLPLVGLSLFGQRISYLFYFLPSVPAVSWSVAYLLHAAGLPPIVRWTALALAVVGFVAYFPFRQAP